MTKLIDKLWFPDGTIGWPAQNCADTDGYVDVRTGKKYSLQGENDSFFKEIKWNRGIYIILLTTYDLLRRRMDSLQEIYTKYDKIIKYSAYTFTGWFVSWVLFFIMLPFMVRYYGKIRGVSLNYGFSWLSMVAIILGLEFGLQPWKSLESTKYNPLKRTLFSHFSDFQTYKIQRTSLNDLLAENISFEIWSPKIEDSVDSKVTPPVLGDQTPVLGGMDW